MPLPKSPAIGTLRNLALIQLWRDVPVPDDEQSLPGYADVGQAWCSIVATAGDVLWSGGFATAERPTHVLTMRYHGDLTHDITSSSPDSASASCECKRTMRAASSASIANSMATPRWSPGHLRCSRSRQSRRISNNAAGSAVLGPDDPVARLWFLAMAAEPAEQLRAVWRYILLWILLFIIGWRIFGFVIQG